LIELRFAFPASAANLQRDFPRKLQSAITDRLTNQRLSTLTKAIFRVDPTDAERRDALFEGFMRFCSNAEQQRNSQPPAPSWSKPIQ
jgi:hypothetical protein